eukprot:scaffold5962_cov331-Prasinococcus_capsulatus_cf.AAC.3
MPAELATQPHFMLPNLWGTVDVRASPLLPRSAEASLRVFSHRPVLGDHSGGLRRSVACSALQLLHDKWGRLLERRP